jgi:hypothetical protein
LFLENPRRIMPRRFACRSLGAALSGADDAVEDGARDARDPGDCPDALAAYLPLDPLVNGVASIFRPGGDAATP